MEIPIVTINDIQFKGGAADYGGVIESSGTLTLNNDFFTGNTASKYGGAIDNNKILTVNNCLFTSNTAPGAFEIGYGSGSAILNNAGCSLVVVKSTFSGNTAGSYAAIFQLGTCTVINSVFTNNVAGEGGAVYTSGIAAASQVSGCTFTNNKAGSTYGGGAIMTYAGPMTVSNSIFNGNTAGNGGALYNYEESFTLINNTVTSNSAPEISQISGG